MYKWAGIHVSYSHMSYLYTSSLTGVAHFESVLDVWIQTTDVVPQWRLQCVWSVWVVIGGVSLGASGLTLSPQCGVVHASWNGQTQHLHEVLSHGVELVRTTATTCLLWRLVTPGRHDTPNITRGYRWSELSEYQHLKQFKFFISKSRRFFYL